jgi:hypothetical protein
VKFVRLYKATSKLKTWRMSSSNFHFLVPNKNFHFSNWEIVLGERALTL